MAVALLFSNFNSEIQIIKAAGLGLVGAFVGTRIADQLVEIITRVARPNGDRASRGANQ